MVLGNRHRHDPPHYLQTAHMNWVAIAKHLCKALASIDPSLKHPCNRLASSDASHFKPFRFLGESSTEPWE